MAINAPGKKWDLLPESDECLNDRRLLQPGLVESRLAKYLLRRSDSNQRKITLLNKSIFLPARRASMGTEG